MLKRALTPVEEMAIKGVRKAAENTKQTIQKPFSAAKTQAMKPQTPLGLFGPPSGAKTINVAPRSSNATSQLRTPTFSNFGSGSKFTPLSAPYSQQQRHTITTTKVAKPSLVKSSGGGSGGGGSGTGGGTGGSGTGGGTATGSTPMSTAAKLVAALSISLGTADAALSSAGADDALEKRGATKEQIAYAKLVVKVLKEITPECDIPTLTNALTAFGSCVSNKDAIGAVRAIGSAATVASSDVRFKIAMSMAQAGMELFSSNLSVEQGVLVNPAAMVAAEGASFAGTRLGMGGKGDLAARGLKAYGQGFSFIAGEGAKQEKALADGQEKFARENIPRVGNGHYPIEGISDRYPIFSDLEQ